MNFNSYFSKMDLYHFKKTAQIFIIFKQIQQKYFWNPIIYNNNEFANTVYYTHLIRTFLLFAINLFRFPEKSARRLFSFRFIFYIFFFRYAHKDMRIFMGLGEIFTFELGTPASRRDLYGRNRMGFFGRGLIWNSMCAPNIYLYI